VGRTDDTKIIMLKDLARKALLALTLISAVQPQLSRAQPGCEILVNSGCDDDGYCPYGFGFVVWDCNGVIQSSEGCCNIA
jgi:hypothetical protein